MIEKIGIVGSGQMGGGIAHVCALAGYQIRLLDVDRERVDAALKTLEKNLAHHVTKGRISEADKTAALARIVAADGYDDLADCDLVIEAASENEEIKRDILKSLSAVLKPEAIIATNTSSISVTRLGTATGRPEKFHFSFQRFLINQLRAAFDFEGTPIVVKSKRKSR
ncbi:MAG: NAD(P)-binding domain-containing protein [Planctomycetes bacterium]|nr:NAD(P)-binding domain-containing protein [Planctomycetota bacterium]